MRAMGCQASPRFFEAADGRLGFRVRLGWRPAPSMVAALTAIDQPAPVA
jgi:hypothetical protein